MTTKAKIIRVAIEDSSEGVCLYATSPDLRGLLVAEEDRTELDKSIPKAIEEIFFVLGERVLALPAEWGDPDSGGTYCPLWVAVPADTLIVNRS